MKTDIHFVLDRSGSMWDILNDTIGGFNQFVSSQQDDPNGECYLNLYQFDHEYQIVYQNKNIKEVELLNKETFQPRGNTALLDAIGRTISSIPYKKLENKNIEKNIENNNNENDNDKDKDKIIFVILTDGEENSSKEFSYNTISKMIEEREKDGWEFVFLGANQDAIKTAGGLGIKQNSAMTYAQTPQNVRACFNSLSSAISRTRSCEYTKINFSDLERMESLEQNTE